VADRETANLIANKIQEAIDLHTEAWANGDFTTESIEGTIQLNSKALGKIDAYSEILFIIADIVEGTDA